ncbi:MAG: hypothetical protein JO257_06685 [Deltaproteobacteria bacterium]|nr:hypothetical protein [Deltaproteobacteria bacterium]
MSRSLLSLTLLAVLVPVVAQAQPGEPSAPEPTPAPAPPPAPEPAPPPAQTPAEPAPPPMSPHDACLARRHEIENAANHATDMDTRTKLLTSLPDCSRSDVVLPPAPPTCGEGQQLVEGQCVGGPGDEHRGATVEASTGLTWATLGGSSAGYSLVNGAAVNFGVGGFVTHDVAMSVRASGTVIADNGFGWIGVLGPNVQGWFGKGFIGGGLGLGVAIGCSSGTDSNCNVNTTSGYDLRLGYRIAPSVTMSFEIESLGGFFGSSGSITLASALIGVQSF